MRASGLALCAALFSPCLLAADGVQLLTKAVSAAQKLNYSGTFVYQHGGRSESSRITHFVDGGKEFEHLEVLDGSPREVLREGDEVRCYLPSARTVYIERRSERDVFHAFIPTKLTAVAEFYNIKLSGRGRVAGMDANIVTLEPKDEFRYGQQFWLDEQSGLLLKTLLINERKETLESFAFTDIKTGIPVSHERMRLRATVGEDWRVRHASTHEGKADDAGWVFRHLPLGFTRTSGMKRQHRVDAPSGMHYVFSDGLASVSAFVEPLAELKGDKAGKGETGLFHMGAMNVYRRVLGDYQITVMGEVPAATVRKLGDGIEPGRKH